MREEYRTDKKATSVELTEEQKDLIELGKKAQTEEYFRDYREMIGRQLERQSYARQQRISREKRERRRLQKVDSGKVYSKIHLN